MSPVGLEHGDQGVDGLDLWPGEEFGSHSSILNSGKSLHENSSLRGHGRRKSGLLGAAVSGPSLSWEGFWRPTG